MTRVQKATRPLASVQMKAALCHKVISQSKYI